MEGFDIYDDLEVLHAQETQKAIEDLQWKEKYQVALSTIQKLQTEKKELNRKIKQLEINFVSLLDTARTEIKRKDKQICELRKEKDDICFRRNRSRPGMQFNEHADVDKDVKTERVHFNPFSREPRKGIYSNTDENLKDAKYLIKSSSEQIGDNKKKFEKSKCMDQDPKHSREREKRRNRSRDRSYDRSRQRNRSTDRLVDQSRNRLETNGDKHRDQLKNRKNSRDKERSKERSKERIKEQRDERKHKKHKRKRHSRSLSQTESSDGSWDRADDKICRSSQRTNHTNRNSNNTTANGYEPSKLEDKTKDVRNTSKDFRKDASEESKKENNLYSVPKDLMEKRVNQKIEILQIEILKDVKEFKKNQAEAEKIKKPDIVDLTKAATEKSNQFLDALFDDSIMNQSELNEDLYNDLEEVPQQSYLDANNTKQENLIKTDENCNLKFQTPQKQSVLKLIDDLFGPSPAGSLCDLGGQQNSMPSMVKDSSDLDFVPIAKPDSSNKAALDDSSRNKYKSPAGSLFDLVEQKNSISSIVKDSSDLDFVPIAKPGSCSKTNTTQQKGDTISQVVLDDGSSDKYFQKNSKEKSSERCLKLETLEKTSIFTAESAEKTRLENQVQDAKTFKFAELDSSFYSSSEDENEAKRENENNKSLNTSQSDIDSPAFEKVSINLNQSSEIETICKTNKSIVEIGKNNSDALHNDLSFKEGRSETKINCKKQDNVEDSTEKYKEKLKDWTKTYYMEKSFKSSHAEKQNQTPKNLPVRNKDNEDKNKNDNLQKQSYSSKHNKNSYDSKSRSTSVKDSHRSSSSRSKKEKHRRHHHRSKESTHSKTDLTPDRESPSSRKHSKKHRHHSSHDNIDTKKRCFQNISETINDTSAVQSSPMLVWSDDHGGSPLNDLSQKEINIDNQDQVIFLHCVDISDDEELLEGGLDSHEYKERTEKYSKTINEKTEDKIIEEDHNSNRDENKINPVEKSVSEASLSTVHDENKISKKSQDSETSKQLKPKNIDMPSFEYSDERNTVELGEEAERIDITTKKEPVPEFDSPIKNQASELAQYINSFQVNDSPPNVDTNLSPQNRMKVENNSAPSHLKSVSNSISKNFSELDANTFLSDKQLNVDNDQSESSKMDDFIENSKNCENEQNNEKVETEKTRLSSYEEQEKPFSKIPHAEYVALNENTQELITPQVELEEAKTVPAELEEPKNVHAEEESYSLAPLNSSKESDENAELLRSSHPRMDTEVSFIQNISANERSNAKEEVRIPSTKGNKDQKFSTSNDNGESPQKISNIINTIDNVQLSLAAKEDNDVFDSINTDKERNGENDSMPSCHPHNFHNEITNSHNLLTKVTSAFEKDVSPTNGNVEIPQDVKQNDLKGKQGTGVGQNLLSIKEAVQTIDVGNVTLPLSDKQCTTTTRDTICQSLGETNDRTTKEQILSPEKDRTETRIFSSQITNHIPTCSTNKLVLVPTTDQSLLNSTTELDTIRSLQSLVSPKKLSNSGDGYDSSHSHSESVSSGRRKKIQTPRKRTEDLKKIPNTIIAIGSDQYTESRDVLSKTIPGHINKAEGNIEKLSIGTGPEGFPDSGKINSSNIGRLEQNTTHGETPDESKSENNDSLSKKPHASPGKGLAIREEQTPLQQTATSVEDESPIGITCKNAEEMQPISSEKAFQKDEHELNFKNDECDEKQLSPPIKAQDQGATENDIESTSQIESKVKLVPEEKKTPIKQPEANETLIHSRLDEVKTKDESFSITIKRKRTDKKCTNHCTDFVEAMYKVVNNKNETPSFAENLKNDTNYCNTEKKETEIAIVTDSNEIQNHNCRNSTSSLIDNTKAANNSSSPIKNTKRNCQEQPAKQHQMMKHFMDSGHTIVGTCNYQSMPCSEGVIENPTEINIKKRKHKNIKLTDALDCDFENSTTGSSSKSYAVAPNLEEAKTRSKRKSKRKTTQNLDSSNSNDEGKKTSLNYIEDSLKDLEGSGIKDSTKKRKHKTDNSIICPVSKTSTEISLTAKILSLESESDELHSSLETAKSVDEILDRLHSQNETADLRLKECLKKLSKEFSEASGECHGKTLEESYQSINQFPSNESVDVIGSSSFEENEQHLVSVKRHNKATRRQKKRKLSTTLDAKTEESFLQPKRIKKLSQDFPSSPINTCDPTSCNGLDINECKSFIEKQQSPLHEKSIITQTTPTHHKIFQNDVFPDDPPPVYSANDDDVQYQELDNRMRSLFQSPSHTQSVNEESSLDQRTDGREPVCEDSSAVAETLNQSRRSECDTSISSKKVSLGPKDYVIESVGTHTANVFITRKRCKKRTKVAGSGV